MGYLLESEVYLHDSIVGLPFRSRERQWLAEDSGVSSDLDRHSGNGHFGEGSAVISESDTFNNLNPTDK